MGLWTRQRAGGALADTSALIHHSDRGVQYLAVHYTQRLAEAGAVASVGTVGDSFDNAMAEAFHSVFKAELARHLGPWRGIDDLEIAIAEYIDWYSHRRLHGEISLTLPAETRGIAAGIAHDGTAAIGLLDVARRQVDPAARIVLAARLLGP